MVKFGLKLTLAWSLVFGNLAQAAAGNSTNELAYTQEIRLEADRATVWNAITQPEIVNTYYLAPLAKLELKIGGQIIYGSLEQPLIAGRVLAVIPGESLQHTFQFDPLTHSGVDENSPSRVTYRIKRQGNTTLLTLIHDRFGGDRQAYANVTAGWPIILGGLKSRVENSNLE